MTLNNAMAALLLRLRTLAPLSGWIVAAVLGGVMRWNDAEPPPPAAAQALPADEPVITLDVSEVPLSALAALLNQQVSGGVGLGSTALQGSGVDESTPVTLHAWREPRDAALRRVTSRGKALPLGIFGVPRIDAAGTRVVLLPASIGNVHGVERRMYDLLPILKAWHHHAAASSLAGNAFFQNAFPAEGEEAVDVIIQHLRQTVTPDSGNDEDGRPSSIRPHGSFIIVHQPAATMRAIEKRLDELAGIRRENDR